VWAVETAGAWLAEVRPASAVVARRAGYTRSEGGVGGGSRRADGREPGGPPVARGADPVAGDLRDCKS
jgi:hypothetical protein